MEIRHDTPSGDPQLVGRIVGLAVERPAGHPGRLGVVVALSRCPAATTARSTCSRSSRPARRAWSSRTRRPATPPSARLAPSSPTASRSPTRRAAGSRSSPAPLPGASPRGAGCRPASSCPGLGRRLPVASWPSAATSSSARASSSPSPRGATTSRCATPRGPRGSGTSCCACTSTTTRGAPPGSSGCSRSSRRRSSCRRSGAACPGHLERGASSPPRGPGVAALVARPARAREPKGHRSHRRGEHGRRHRAHAPRGHLHGEVHGAAPSALHRRAEGRRRLERWAPSRWRRSDASRGRRRSGPGGHLTRTA